MVFSAVAWLERDESTFDPNQACPLRLHRRQKGSVMMRIGIDPHKGSHTAVVIDSDERVVDEIRVRTSTGQASELLEWVSGYPDRAWAVESARGMGYLVSQQLVATGERVVDVPAMMVSRVRLLGSGKS